jgi:hypothetical protein
MLEAMQEVFYLLLLIVVPYLGVSLVLGGLVAGFLVRRYPEPVRRRTLWAAIGMSCERSESAILWFDPPTATPHIPRHWNVRAWPFPSRSG